MKTKVIQIDSSRDLRIPKTLLRQSGLTGTVRLEVQRQKIIIRSASKAREGWTKVLRAISAKDAGQLHNKESAISLSNWDETEWVW